MNQASCDGISVVASDAWSGYDENLKNIRNLLREEGLEEDEDIQGVLDEVVLDLTKGELIDGK